eukprot:7913528-Pyramimonas_sp.AAC.1
MSRWPAKSIDGALFQLMCTQVILFIRLLFIPVPFARTYGVLTAHSTQQLLAARLASTSWRSACMGSPPP